jgi:hypothetical protein
VRCSGLKGIRDAIQSLASKDVLAKSQNKDDLELLNLGISILEANLPSLLPNMCRCWLDEEEDVRNLAMQLFGDILSNLSVPCKVVNGVTTSHLTCLVPFVPFLCAYASSALNSLDRSIRKDGALIVGMMASCKPYPSFLLLAEGSNTDAGLAVLRTEVGKHIDLFLPSIERLLSSMSFGGRAKPKNAGAAKQKRKRDESTATKTTESSPSSFKTLGAANTTILSLALLLKASLSGDDNISSSYGHESVSDVFTPSLHVSGESTFLRGGSANANSILLLRGAQSQDSSSSSPMNSVRSIWDLPYMPVDEVCESAINSFQEDFTLAESTSTPTADDNIEKAQVLITLVETIRMKFVELTQAGRSTDQKGIMLPASDLDTLDTLVNALKFANRRSRLFRDMIDAAQLREYLNASNKRQKKTSSIKTNTDAQDLVTCVAAYQSSISKLVIIILENFPICSFGGTSTSRYNLTNAELCSSLAELGGEIHGLDESSSPWVDAVFSYILPRLTPDSSEHRDGGADAVMNVLLKIARKLLLPTSNSASGLVYLLKSSSKRQELLQVFSDVFFPYKVVHGSNGCIDSVTKEGQGLWLMTFASTSAGRTAAMLLTALISCCGDTLAHPVSESDERFCIFILQMASVLPVYLLAWKHKCPLESGKVLASMLSVARRWSLNNNAQGQKDNISSSLTKLCNGYRSSMDVMVRPAQTPTKGKSSSLISIFEMSPETIQKLTLGLINMLGEPNTKAVSSLSKICSRAFSPNTVSEDTVVRISASMGTYIIEVMHHMRKCMQVATYLTFLINASGIEKTHLPEDTSKEHLFSYDCSIQMLCRFLICSQDSAPAKVLPMIRPTIEKWISVPTESSRSAMKQIIRARAALSIIAAFTWDESHDQPSAESSVQSDFLKLDDDFDQLILNCMLNMFELLVKVDLGKSSESKDGMQQEQTARLLGPVTLLLCYREGMLAKYLQEVSARISKLTQAKQGSDSSSWATAEGLMKVLLLTLNSKQPASVSTIIIRHTELQKFLLLVSENIEKAVSSSHLMYLSEKLSHEAKNIIRLCSPTHN